MEQETVTQKQEKRQAKTGVTRAAKASRQKEILRALLKNRPYKWNELLEEAVKIYVEKYGDEPIDVPDLKGKFGSNFSLLEEAGEAAFDKTTNLCSAVIPARKRERKTAQTKRAASSQSGEAESGTESATESATEAATTTAATSGVKARRTKTKRNTEAAEGAEAKNAAEPIAAAQSEAASGEKRGEAGKKLSNAISAEEEKRAAIETALKKAVEKAAAGKASRTSAKKSAAGAADSAAAEAVGGAEAQRQEKTATKTARRRGEKTSENADAASAQPLVAPVVAPVVTPAVRIAADGAATQKTVPNPAENPAQKLAEKPAAKTESEAKTAERAEKKAVKSGLLLTEFAFLGNASKRTEKTADMPNATNAKNVTNAPNAEKAGKEPQEEEGKTASAARANLAENTKNVRGMGENNAAEARNTEAKNAAPVGATNAQAAPIAQTAQNAVNNAVRAVATRPQSVQNSQNAQSAENGRKPNAQNAQSARGGETRRSGANAAGGGRAGAKYALIQSADEKLKEEFLRRLRSMSGEYFEYYAVYLLERYSLKNGRRLESLRVSGGKNDGGIDGEIELTDRFGFRETIYIQAKNWDPTKGVAEKWMIGETLIQQFVGAATCRQSKDGKRNCRGIFMTTSTFTKEAKEILSVLGEKFIGYDGDDVYEAAKECSFGVIPSNGGWQLDEKLLSGEKAFFNM